jgi:hypothetical protein
VTIDKAGSYVVSIRPAAPGSRELMYFKSLSLEQVNEPAGGPGGSNILLPNELLTGEAGQLSSCACARLRTAGLQPPPVMR